MINTSKAYREAVSSENREFIISDKITLQDGTILNLSKENLLAYTIDDATSKETSFDVGGVVMKKYTISIDNSDGNLDNKNFEKATIVSSISLVLEDEKKEVLKKGTYYVFDAKLNDYTVDIVAYDAMLKFNRPFSDCNVSFPVSAKTLLNKLCESCSVLFDTSTLSSEEDFTVYTRPESDTLTCRDVLSYIAQAFGCYAKVNTLDHLVLGWYPFEKMGNMSPEGALQTGEYHYIHNLSSRSADMSDIKITGIQINYKVGDTDISKMYGGDKYALVISDNPLIESRNVNDILARVGSKIVGNTFRPLSITCQPDPCIEAGDIAIVEDHKGNIYKTVITNTTYTVNGSQKITCGAESQAKKEVTSYSASTRLLDKAKRQKSTDLTNYEAALENANQLAANSFGFYATDITLEDGSMVSYRHDKPNLQDSKFVYKASIEGVFATTDYQGNDDATTVAGKWSSAATMDGNAILHMLALHKLTADYIDVQSLVVNDFFVHALSKARMHDYITDPNFVEKLQSTTGTSAWYTTTINTRSTTGTLTDKDGNQQNVAILGNDATNGYAYLRRGFNVKKGSKLTISFKAACESNASGTSLRLTIPKFFENDSNKTFDFPASDMPNFSESKELKEFSFDIENLKDYEMSMQFNGTGKGTYYITDVHVLGELNDLLETVIRITDEGFESKVSKADLFTIINQSAEELLFKGNRLVVEADNFSLDKTGKVSMKEAEIKGNLDSIGKNKSIRIKDGSIYFFDSSNVSSQINDGNIWSTSDKLIIDAGNKQLNLQSADSVNCGTLWVAGRATFRGGTESSKGNYGSTSNVTVTAGSSRVKLKFESGLFVGWENA